MGDAADPRDTSGSGLRTIPAAFRDAVREHAARVALRRRGPGGAFEDVTYAELDRASARLAAALRGLGLGAGDRVAIVGYHGPSWVVADLAVLRLGGVVVPVYHTLSPASMRHVLADAGCRLAFVEDADLLAAVESVRDGVPTMEHVVAFSAAPSDAGPACPRLEDLLGEAPPAAASASEPPALAPGDTATIVYTSGTTGEPKGVVLTHGNILSNVRAVRDRFRIGPDDVFLSFLPLCHMFERTCGYYTMLLSGAPIAFAGSLATIVEDVQAVRPTVLITVPRLLERVFEAVQREVAQGSALRRRLVDRGVRCLHRRHGLRFHGKRVSLGLRLRSAFYDRFVAARFRRIAGGRLRLLVSGGAALDRRIAKTLLALGLHVCEGYGLTETSPVVAAATPEEGRLGTVGRPLEGVEVRIGEADEILVRGPNVMQGYHGRPEDTARAIDPDGWFHTGDQGRIDADGHLAITGRIKELLVTSYGKKVAPAPIEAAIARCRHVEQVLVLGDDRKYVTALIVPDRAALEAWARAQEIAAPGYEELLATPQVRALLAAEIEAATPDLARYEKVRRFALLAEPFTVGGGLLTPTLKVRRARVLAAYRDVVEALYAGPEGGA